MPTGRWIHRRSWTGALPALGGTFVNDEENDVDVERLTPREFLKARRPHLFSDSVVHVDTELPRKVFEYHLHTITSRKEEVEFENFVDG